MESLDGVLIVGIIFFSVVTVIKIISDNRIRHRLIETGSVNEHVKNLPPVNGSHVLASLKWGFVLIGLGFALLISQLAPSDIKAEITLGGMFLMAGAGLLIYYFIAEKLNKNATK